MTGVFEGRDLASLATVERADVCIIGSGCGGATVAVRLAEAGYSVVIIEQGGWYTATDFDQREANSLAKLDGGRGLEGSVDGGVQLSYGNNAGGASVHYWADSYRTPPDRLALWAERFGLEGHDLAALTPHFEVLERDLNVHLATDDRVNRMNAAVRDAAAALGWSAARVPQARKGCVGSGYCHQGCSYDAKQSQLVTHLPRALAAGARLYCDTRAGSLSWEGARVKTLFCRVLDRGTGQPTGGSVEVEARAFVVAAGGYATPAFLLAQGLKTRLQQVGEHLFCNPCPMVFARFDEEIVLWRDIPAAWGVDEFRLARHETGRPGAPSPFFGEQGAYVEGGYLLMPNQLQPALLAAALPGVSRTHHELMRNSRHIGGTICWIDDAEEGRMVVSVTGRKLHVPLTGGNELRIRDAWKKQARLLLQAGARELVFGDAADTRVTRATEIDAAVASLDLRAGRNLLAAPHPGGGARMGKDEVRGVVGFDHRVHNTDNLYIADPSVFPTSPSVDPSLTIMAFSCVAARAIAGSLG